MIDLAFMKETLFVLMRGVPLTLNLTFVSVASGAVLASLLAAMRVSRLAVLQKASAFYVFVFRGTPLLIQIFLIYYGLGQFRPTLQEWGLWSFLREPYWCAILALSFNTAAYGSEIIRGGLQSVPQQQIEAGRAYGMSGLLLLRRVIIPIALRQALPAYGNELILMLKATSLVSIITMMEITGIAAKLIADTFRTMEVFIVAGSIYLVMNFLITRFIGILEWSISPRSTVAAALKP